MRITSGRFKGRVLRLPKGMRPTQEKVRKALFDILGDIEGLSFLELFAGSGAVGFEAVSRGVKDLVLVETNRDCQLAIAKNIETLKAKACDLYPLTVEDALKNLNKEGRVFDIVFLDPPYYKEMSIGSASLGKKTGGWGAKGEVGGSLSPRLRSGLATTSNAASLAKKTLQMLGACAILAPNGFIIAQHFKKDNLPIHPGDLQLFRQSKYGDTVLSFYRKK